jgi:polyhydroxyalkanoate synthesis regulator protein
MIEGDLAQQPALVLKLPLTRRKILSMADQQNARTDSILIKRYAGRRLYNTASLTYVSLDDLANMITNDHRFVVRDAETGADITSDILSRLH